MLEQWRMNDLLLLEMIRAQLPAEIVVDDRIAAIQHLMSNPVLELQDLYPLSENICHFMSRSGLDWRHELAVGECAMKMFRFLQLKWGHYNIPANLDDMGNNPGNW
jgi:hypothetical protein